MTLGLQAYLITSLSALLPADACDTLLIANINRIANKIEKAARARSRSIVTTLGLGQGDNGGIKYIL
jgi:hypothetical protein